jgi:hypothetical protein
MGDKAPTNKSVPWYQAEPPKPLSQTIREVLENYSGIPSSEVESHILAVVSCPLQARYYNALLFPLVLPDHSLTLRLTRRADREGP